MTHCGKLPPPAPPPLLSVKCFTWISGCTIMTKINNIFRKRLKVKNLQENNKYHLSLWRHYWDDPLPGSTSIELLHVGRSTSARNPGSVRINRNMVVSHSEIQIKTKCLTLEFRSILVNNIVDGLLIIISLPILRLFAFCVELVVAN